jgi:polyisoprenoid-binding protein YceI
MFSLDTRHRNFGRSFFRRELADRKQKACICFPGWGRKADPARERISSRMKRFAVSAAVFFLAAPLATAQISIWKSDPAQSRVEFTIRHLGVTDVRGRMAVVNANVQYDAADVSQSRVTATIGVDTVTTGEAGRDDEIKSADFLDVDRFPQAIFNSTAVSKNGNGMWVRGNLTLHGITREVVLNVRGPDKPVMGSDGKAHSGFSATTTLDRSAFEIGPSFPAAIVGDRVTLSINLQIVKQ